MDAAGALVSVLQGPQHGDGDLSRVVLCVGREAGNGIKDFAAVQELNIVSSVTARGWEEGGLGRNKIQRQQ